MYGTGAVILFTLCGFVRKLIMMLLFYVTKIKNQKNERKDADDTKKTAVWLQP